MIFWVCNGPSDPRNLPYDHYQNAPASVIAQVLVIVRALVIALALVIARGYVHYQNVPGLEIAQGLVTDRGLETVNGQTGVVLKTGRDQDVQAISTSTIAQAG